MKRITLCSVGVAERVPRKYTRKVKPPSLGCAKLRQWMRERDVTRADLARMMGLTPSWAWHLVGGKSIPSVERAAQLRRRTGCLISDAEWVTPYPGNVEDIDVPCDPGGRPPTRALPPA